MIQKDEQIQWEQRRNEPWWEQLHSRSSSKSRQCLFTLQSKNTFRYEFSLSLCFVCPVQPSTVLTNLQRGNIQTPLMTGEPRLREVHELAALGELFPNIVNLGDCTKCLCSEKCLSFSSTADGADVNKVDEYGLTPVLWAASYGQLESFNKLKDQGANLNLKGPTSETVLMFAAANGHSHVVKALVAEESVNIDDVDEVRRVFWLLVGHNNQFIRKEIRR